MGRRAGSGTARVRVLRRAVVLATPVLVPASMGALFTALKRRTTPQRAYNVGFATYWGLWCYGFPTLVLGPRRALAVLRSGRRLTPGELVLLTLPVVGGVVTTLLPNRHRVDARVAAVMVGTATLNAVGEELLWRGVFLEQLEGRGRQDALAVWSWLGFTAWHLAPQVVLPSPLGRARFTAAAGLVGAAATVVAWRGAGLRATVLPHLLTDACGVRAAEFRLGLAVGSNGRRRQVVGP